MQRLRDMQTQECTVTQRHYKDSGISKGSETCKESGTPKNSGTHRKRDAQTFKHRNSLDAHTLDMEIHRHTERGRPRH